MTSRANAWVLIADTSLPGLGVARELDAVIAIRGRPAMIVSDNGTDFTQHGNAALVTGTAGRMALHCAGQAAAECLHQKFQRSLRDELLNETLFSSLAHAREICRVETRLQHCPTAQRSRQYYASRLRRPQRFR